MADSLFVLSSSPQWDVAVPSVSVATLLPSSSSSPSPRTPNLRSFLTVAITVALGGLAFRMYRRAAAKPRQRRRPTGGGACSPRALALAAAGCTNDTSLAEATPSEPNERWIKLRELGRGSFGIVYEGIDQFSGQRIAIKEMREVTLSDDCRREFQLLRGVRHHSIVTMYALEDDPRGGSRLILELCSGGSLLDILATTGPLSEKRLLCYTRQLLLGLQVLHGAGIIHRDLKPANILLDGQGRVKLSDFGLSRHLDSIRTRTGIAGSPVYMSPEAMDGRYRYGTDLWALGATLSHLATGQVPWSHVTARDLRNPHALMLYIAYGPKPGDPLPADHHPEVPATLSSRARDFLNTLFAPDPDRRGTAAEHLRHPWVTNGGPPIDDNNYLSFLDGGADPVDEDATPLRNTTSSMGP